MKPLQADSSTPVVPSSVSSQHIAARGIAQTLGIHPAIAILTVAVDFMLFPLDAASLGTDLPFSIAVSCAVGFLAFKGQQAWYGDTRDSAMTKAGILALLTAIPSPLPAFLWLPMGALGFFRRNKN